MTRLKEFLFKYKHAIIILYMPIYLLWFTSLEKRTNVHFTDIHCKIDDYIPFCEFFIIPYLLWFLYVAVSLVYLFFQTKHLDDFYRCCAVLLLGMTTSLLIYTIFPNQQTMRPKTFDHSNIFTTIIDILYRTDTDTNVFPSIHVFNSITLLLAYYRCRIFEQPRRRWMRPAAAVLCISIVCSTVLLKQHSCIDVALGALLALALDALFTRSEERSEVPQMRWN